MGASAPRLAGGCCPGWLAITREERRVPSSCGVQQSGSMGRLFHFRRETATTTSSDPHARHFAPPRRLVRPSAACHAHLIVESNRIDHPHAYYQQGWPLFFIETRRANNRTTTASEAAVPAPLTHQHPPSHPHRIRTPSLAAWRASLGGGGSCRASLPTWVSSRHWPCKYVSASASRVCV